MNERNKAIRNSLIILVGLFVLFAILFVGGMADCNTIAPC